MARSTRLAILIKIICSISGRSAGCGCIISPTKVTVGSMRQSVRGANGKWQQISQSDDALSGIVGKSPVRKLVLAVCEPNAQGVRSFKGTTLVTLL
uniref:HDC12270 n=1 Tax=Drosophila melanogaster TaxID=7227 RepID=Q6IKJ8_DROME|nr:TPA_inf: HDC12270 [Drosophila melanogaster]